MKKIFLVVLSFLMVVLPVFAGDTLIRWDWLNNDSSVQYYRYQIDGTDPASWTVVDGTVSSFETDTLDPYTDHTLYLEGSYDGIYWSDTASAVAYALERPAAVEVVEEAPVVEEVLAVEEVPAETVAEAAEPEVVVPEVEAAPVVEPVAPAPEAKSNTNDFAFSLLLKGGFISNSTVKPFDLAFDPELKAGIGLDFANVVKLGDSMGLGLRTDIDVVAVPDAGYYRNLFNGAYVFKKSSYEGLKADGTALLTFTARGKVVAFNLGLGGGVSFGYKGDAENQTGSFSMSKHTVSVGAFGALNTGLRFYIGDVFSLGLEGTARMMIPNWQDVRYSADLVLGFTF